MDRVIRRQFFINEGDPINPNEIKAAVERIRALDLFSKVDVKTVPGKRQSEVYVRVEVEEKPTGTLSFGAGYSSDSGLGGIFEYSEKNFLGRGQSFLLRLGLEQMTNFTNFRSLNLCFSKRSRFRINLSLKDTNHHNAAYDTKNTKFQPFIIIL